MGKLYNGFRFYLRREGICLFSVGILYAFLEILFVDRLLSNYNVGDGSIADYYLLGNNGYYLFFIVNILIVFLSFWDDRSNYLEAFLTVDRKQYILFEQIQLLLHVGTIVLFFNVSNLLTGFVRRVPLIDFDRQRSIFSVWNKGLTYQNPSFLQVFILTNVYLFSVLIFLANVSSLIKKYMKSKLYAMLIAAFLSNTPAYFGVLGWIEVNHGNVIKANYRPYLWIWLMNLVLVRISIRFEKKKDMIDLLDL